MLYKQLISSQLQTPASFTQSIQELMIALSRTEDSHNLSALAIDFNTLAAINPATGTLFSYNFTFKTDP